MQCSKTQNQSNMCLRINEVSAPRVMLDAWFPDVGQLKTAIISLKQI